jgi:hypothetical protein
VLEDEVNPASEKLAFLFYNTEDANVENKKGTYK